MLRYPTLRKNKGALKKFKHHDVSVTENTIITFNITLKNEVIGGW